MSGYFGRGEAIEHAAETIPDLAARSMSAKREDRGARWYLEHRSALANQSIAFRPLRRQWLVLPLPPEDLLSLVPEAEQSADSTMFGITTIAFNRQLIRYKLSGSEQEPTNAYSTNRRR